MASDKPKKLTRRDFLKLSGAASLGLALSACGLAPTSTVTPAPTNTPLLTATFTPTLSPTSTNTPAPASTPTATPTPRPPTFRELADMAGIEIVTYCFWQKLLDSNYTKSYLTIANKMRIGYELENSQIYNAYFDWQRVLGEWERVRKELSEGSIPFEQEVFDPLYISRTEMLISFARKNNLSLIGSGMLFWSGGTPDILKINLSPEEKRKILEFMVKAKVMRFRDVGEWAGVSELSACELWGSDWFKRLYSELGGRKIIHDVFIWAKEANPSVKLYIVDEPILDTNNDEVRQNVANFLQLLEYLKKIGTPIDGVETENNFWIYAPPNKQNMKTLLSQIKDKGYEIVAPEMVVAISDKFPVWPERPRTVQSISNKLVAHAEIYRETLEAYLEVGCSQFGLFSGTDAITWFTEIGYPDAEPEILDKNYQPKPAYYSLWDVLLKYALQRQPSATTAPHIP